MVVVQTGYFGAPRLDPNLWVYDKTSGEMLAEIPLPANATGSSITYISGGKQYIAFPVGGGPLVEEIVAVSRSVIGASRPWGHA
jgi:hypothetical protein